MNTYGPVRLVLPVLFCKRCRSQLVNYLFVVVGTTDLVCLFCARDAAAHGDGHQVAPLMATSADFVPEAAPALEQDDAVALLLVKGAQLAGSRTGVAVR